MTIWQQLFRRSSQPDADRTSRLIAALDTYSVNQSVDQNVSILENILVPNEDFSIRRFEVLQTYRAAIVFFSDLVNQDTMNMVLLKSLMKAESVKKVRNAPDLVDAISRRILYHNEVMMMDTLKECVNSILEGNAVLFVEGLKQAFVIDTRQVSQRAVTQPETERVIRGPRDGFIEIIDTNLSLIRYRLRTPFLRTKSLGVGEVTKSKVIVCYIEGITNQELVDEVINRIQQINIDGVLSVGYIEQFIEDNHWSPFPQIFNTERPDKVVANLLEGRVAILLDGSPIALIAPAQFSQFYQTLDDYTERFMMGTLVRFIRMVALLFSLVFSSLYVAILSFNPELIPTKFAVAVASGRAGVPFPPVIEVLFMEVSMEVLREATIRLPQQVGGALSIVGVLVVGQAAVEAGFASPITVVVIALTTIGSFATPAYNAAIALRMLRFPLIILAGTFGLYGLMIGMILISIHAVSLKSFGVPYLAPAVPEFMKSLKDLIIRAPLFRMFHRPQELRTGDPIRQGPYLNSKKDVLDPSRFTGKGGRKP